MALCSAHPADSDAISKALIILASQARPTVRTFILFYAEIPSANHRETRIFMMDVRRAATSGRDAKARRSGVARDIIGEGGLNLKS
jgi:hypothetical protein